MVDLMCIEVNMPTPQSVSIFYTYRSSLCIYVPYKLVGLLYAGCEYGDRYPDECRRGRASLCYHDDYRARCCATCVAGPLAHCEFGDRTSWCPTIPASQCYDDEDNCCETCHNYKTGKPGISIGLSVSLSVCWSRASALYTKAAGLIWLPFWVWTMRL